MFHMRHEVSETSVQAIHHLSGMLQTPEKRQIWLLRNDLRVIRGEIVVAIMCRFLDLSKSTSPKQSSQTSRSKSLRLDASQEPEVCVSSTGTTNGPKHFSEIA